MMTFRHSHKLPQERQSRDAVVLPFEHQGKSQHYSSDDFTSYLPPSAGGKAAGQGNGKMGHIKYVRDSDSEPPDSDEDVDDDLDF